MNIRLLALLLGLALASGHAETVVDNLGSPLLGDDNIFLAGQGSAQAFTTGSAESVLRSVSVRLRAPDSNPTDPIVELWAGEGNFPTERLASLGTIDDLPDSGSTTYVNYTVESDAELTLAASTRYWIVLLRGSGGAGFHWGVTTGTASSGTGSIDPLRATTFQSGNSWSTASQTNAHQFNVVARPVVFVQNDADSGAGSLRQAVLDIPAGGVIRFDPSLSGGTIDQRGFPVVGSPDTGAAEFQGSPDLALLWETDSDGDGSPFGLEFASGTDSGAPDAASFRNSIFNSTDGESIIAFGRNPAADEFANWIVQRSSPGLDDFQEIYRFDGSTSTAIPGIEFSVDQTGIIVTDTDPPAGPASFYRVGIELKP